MRLCRVLLSLVVFCQARVNAENHVAKTVRRIIRAGVEGDQRSRARAKSSIALYVPARLSFEDFEKLLAEVMKGNPTEDEGEKEITITPANYLSRREVAQFGDAAAKSYTYMLVLPAHYTPSRPYPLIVGMHGAMGNPTADFLWMKWCVKLKGVKDKAIMIVSLGTRAGDHSVAGVIAATRKTLEETSAHPGAVLLMCYSNSGKTNIRILEKKTSIFSANYIYASFLPSINLIQRMPIYAACGEKDFIFYSRMSSGIKPLLQQHPDLTWKIIPKRSHNFEVKDFPRDVFPWLLDRVPDMRPFSAEFSLRHGTIFSKGISFLRVVPRTKHFLLSGKVENNSLKLTLQPKSALRLLKIYFPEEFFDLSERCIAVTVNGKRLPKKRITAKASTALESAAYYREASKACVYSVSYRL